MYRLNPYKILIISSIFLSGCYIVVDGECWRKMDDYVAAKDSVVMSLVEFMFLFICKTVYKLDVLRNEALWHIKFSVKCD